MRHKFSIAKTLNRLRAWTVPIISLSAFLPLLITYSLYSDKTAAKTEKASSLPPLSQIPAPNKKLEQPLITEDPVISDQTSTPVIQTPKPIISPKSKPPKTKTPETKTPTTKQTATKTVEKSSKTQTPTKTEPSSPSSLAPAPPNYTAPALEMRVAVLTDAAGTNLATSTPATILDRNGQPLQSISPNQALGVYPSGSSLNIGSSSLPGVVFVQPANGGLVYVGDRWYRGKMLLVSQGSSILAVNYVNMEEYLYSVVGSEMHPTAPMEALKAQAIAARSYALVHFIRPASAWYHLGDSQRWQVYKGIKSEYNTTQQAVNETAGQILSYRGGVVESLYAATDEIVSRAHGGRGMSQIGSYGLANQGYNYERILSYYYPGVGLARLILQQ